MKCGVCNRPYRTGTLATVVVGGELKSRRVCPTCAKRGVLLIAPGGTTARCKCGNTATTCAGCANAGERRDAAAVMKAAIKKLEGVQRTYEKTADPGSVAESLALGIEQAVDILKAGDF